MKEILPDDKQSVWKEQSEKQGFPVPLAKFKGLERDAFKCCEYVCSKQLQVGGTFYIFIGYHSWGGVYDVCLQTSLSISWNNNKIIRALNGLHVSKDLLAPFRLFKEHPFSERDWELVAEGDE